MAQDQAANKFVTALSAAALVVDATLTLTSLTGAPAYPYKLTN